MQIGTSDIPRSTGLPKVSDYNKLVDYVNILRKINLGPNIEGRVNPSGVYMNAVFSQRRNDQPAKPWDIQIIDNDFVLTNCIFMIGGATKVFENQTVGIEGTDLVYVALHYNMDSNTISIQQSGSMNSVIDITTNFDSEIYKKLLYSLVKTDRWLIATDYRDIPTGPIYS